MSNPLVRLTVLAWAAFIVVVVPTYVFIAVKIAKNNRQIRNFSEKYEDRRNAMERREEPCQDKQRTETSPSGSSKPSGA
jgi:uncharacterized protein (DUF111 family)